MKRFVIATIGLVGVVGVTALADRPAKETPRTSRAYLHSYNLPSSGVALEGYCPVTYLTVNRAVKGRDEYTSTYNGVTYHFASGNARKMFEADPEQYLPAYGGWCAFGMAVKDKFPVDPTNFKIANGKLMLFLRNQEIDAQQLWNDGNERELVAQAAAHWKKVSG